MNTDICEVPLGTGGAIFNKNTVLEVANSIFDHNNAYKGGAIGTISNYGEYSTYKPKASLNLTNCSFTNNVANSTIEGNNSNLILMFIEIMVMVEQFTEHLINSLLKILLSVIIRQ